LDDLQTERIGTLDQWLPKLHAYSAAMNANSNTCFLPVEQRSIGVPSVEQREIGVPSVDHGTISVPPVNSQPTPILHLPLDGILAKLQKTRPYLLGFARSGPENTSLENQIVREVALRCASKTDRKTLVVHIAISNSKAARFVPLPEYTEQGYTEQGLTMVRWESFGESKQEKLLWNTQLAQLIQYRQEYGLIVLDLGDVQSELLFRMGRLCDGILIQLLDNFSELALKKSMQRIQHEQLKVIGVMSLDRVPADKMEE
jgi:hypothetical protein